MRKLVPVLACFLLAACGGPPAAVAPKASGNAAAQNAALVSAMELEAHGDQEAAARAYLDVLVGASASTDPLAVARAVSAADALVRRTPFPGVHSALVDRTSVDPRAALEAAYEGAKGPFGKGIVASTLTTLAENQGDPIAAERWRARAGCVRSAAMFGPLSWSSLLATSEPDPLAERSAPMPAEVRSESAMLRTVKRVDYMDRGCFIDAAAVSDEGGAREILVDADVPRAGTVGVVLRSRSGAVLRAQGRPIVMRGYDEGGELVDTYGTFNASAGTVRLAVRVGLESRGQGVEIDVFGADGAPLATHAPAAGSVATARVDGEGEIAATLGTPGETLVASAFALASGRGRRVERLLTEKPLAGKEAPLANVLLSRALTSATDLPPVERAERQRAVVENVLTQWPDAWEQIAMHAALAAQRKGAGEAKLEALADLDAHKGKANGNGAPLLALFEAILAAEARIYDRASPALARAQAALGKTGLYAEAVARAVPRTPRESIDVSCGSRYKNDHACYLALTSNAEWDRARAELARLRALGGAPKRMLGMEAILAIGRGDRELARRIVKDALPGERSIGITQLAGDVNAPLSLARTAPDSPRALLWAESWTNASPLAAFAGRAEAAVEKAKADKGGDAATTILDREERYELTDEGILHFLVFDVRKVSGTADVESNAQAGAPALFGRDASRVLRRRILKKDGRVLTPEQTPHAQQQHADLAQLETGDAIEAIYEGFALPGDNGVLAFDSPDLLPARTAVRSATITVTLPASLRDRLIAHPTLGAPKEKASGANVELRYALTDAPVRRLEDGVPRMDRSVGIVFSSASWGGLARAIGETERSLEGASTELASLSALLAADKTDRDKIDHVVTLTGQRLKQGLPGAFADFEGQRPAGGQSVQLRTFLASHEGSRTFMAKKILAAVNIPSEIVVAESEPFSANPQMVPHVGRFSHPLLLVHPQSASGGEKRDDVWLDLDVPGPPLPAGRVSPELRGKSALYADGQVRALPAQLGESDPDEIDLRLVLDKNGDAKGDLTILLRGRTAQDIAEAFELVVGDERERVLRGVVLGWVPYASVDTVSLSSSEGSSQVAVRASLTVPGYAQAEGKSDADRAHVLPGLDPVHYVYPRPYTTTLSSTYATQAGRKSAFAINRALLVHVHRRVEVPEGTKTVRVPGPFDTKRTNLKASRTVTVQKSAIEEDFKLSVPSGTVSAADYGDFVTQLHNADDAFLTSIRVKLQK